MSVFTGPGLVFVGERECHVEEAVVDEASLGAGEVLIEVDISVVSAGTEVANFTGLDPGTRVPGSWNFYPHRPGYGSIGRVVALGRPSTVQSEYTPGDRVFAICRHARYTVADPATASRRPHPGRRRPPKPRPGPHGVSLNYDPAEVSQCAARRARCCPGPRTGREFCGAIIAVGRDDRRGAGSSRTQSWAGPSQRGNCGATASG